MRQIGNASHLLHIRPWEWQRLTTEETDVLLDWLDDYKRQQDEAAAEIGRG